MKQKYAVHRIIAAALLLALLTGCVTPGPVGEPGASTADTTVPTVTTMGNLEMQLQGEGVITLEYGEMFVDPGVSVTWNGQSVEAEVAVDLPEFGKPGAYAVTYSAVYNGVTAQLTRGVLVVDTQPPVITLVSDPAHVTEIGETYQEEGFTAEDNCDGDLTARVQRYQEGDTVYYTVSDSSGNSVTVARVITYGDSVPPVITLLGEASVTMMAGQTYQEPGFTAADNVDGDITGRVMVSNTYDRYQPGTYEVTYSVMDTHGNKTQVTRSLTVQGYVQPETVKPDGKVIYLTFDDGPSSFTPKLLNILAKYNIKATFFVVGNGELKYLDDIVEAGHSIGIHSNTHEYSEIYASEDAFFKDFNAVRQKIYDHTGVWTTLCRFPGGSSNRTSKQYCTGIMTRLTKAVEAMGYQYFDWNVTSGDAGETKSTDQIFKNVTNGVKGRDYSIVLQHDIFGYSVNAVERIIQWGLANGYTFLPLDPTSPTAHHQVKN